MEIIKNKPMPPSGRSKGRARLPKYDIADQLEVGDCAIVADRKESSAVTKRLIRADKKVTRRTLPDGTIGVWRIE